MRYPTLSTIGCALWIAGLGATFAQGSVSYQLQGGSGDYSHHALSATLNRSAAWASLSAGSGYAGSKEVGQDWSVGVGGALGPHAELDASLGQTKDTALSTDEFTSAAWWNTPIQWVPDAPVRLGLRWGLADYSLRNSALAGADRVPDQYRWALSASLPLTHATSLSLQSQWNRYTVDPVAMAAQLLQRRRPRINAALGLADFASFEHRATLQWLAGKGWRWSAGGSYGQTVLGQSLRSVDASLEIPWSAATSVGLALQHAQSDEVLHPNGQVALPYQSSNSLSLSWNWSWD